MMFFRKVVFVFVISAIAAITAGCSKNGEDEESQDNLAASQKNLALIISTLSNPFFVTLKEGAEIKASQKGYNLLVLDSQDSAEKEIKNMEDITVKDISAVLLNPADSDAAGSTVTFANKVGIPVVTIDRNASRGEVRAHIASDNVSGGKIAGDYIIEKLGGKGKVIQLEGIPGASAARERGEGFLQVIQGSGVDLVASQPAWFDRTKALNVTENLLQAHPDVNAIFAQNDEMALGAVKAVQAAKKDILIIGFDGTEEGINAVNSGELSATIAQQADVMGEKALEVADKIINGETVETYIPVELKLVTKP